MFPYPLCVFYTRLRLVMDRVVMFLLFYPHPSLHAALAQKVRPYLSVLIACDPRILGPLREISPA